MRVALLVLLSICLACGVAFGGAANTTTGNEEQPVVTQSGIPNFTVQDENGNGRAQHMDKAGDKEGDELTPVERRIIVRDAIISNRGNPSNPAGQ